MNHAIGRPLQSLILRARAEHDCDPGATADQIAAAEARLGYAFTDDLRALLTECNGIRFWANGNFPCRLLPAHEIEPVRFVAGDEGPPGLVALVEAQGEIVAMGLDRESKMYSWLVDCFHETFPDELHGVCESLPELIALILDSNDSEWLWPAARAAAINFAE